jgi:hypothetical protein
MAAIAFDTLQFARRLMAAGVPEKQAEAQAELMAEAFVYNLDSLATKDFIEASLDARFANQDARNDNKFAEYETRLNAKFSSIDVQFAEMKGHFRLIYWMLAVVIAGTVVPSLAAFFSN